MPNLGPVRAQYPPPQPRLPFPINGTRDYTTDSYYSRANERPSLTALNTRTPYHKVIAPFPTIDSPKIDQTRGISSASRSFYDPIQDRSEPAKQREEYKLEVKTSDTMMSGRSPESTISSTSRVPLPRIPQLDSETHTRSSERRSPPSNYSAKSPISLSQPFTSPYPLVGGSQPYHSIYSESSPASNHNTQSPRDQYVKAVASGSPSHYDSYRYRESSGPTSLTDMRSPQSAGTQATFSPMSNERTPIADPRPFSQDGQSPPLHLGVAVPGGYQCAHEHCADRPPFQTQYLLSSHQNVHKPDRPYYCQVPECPRSKNGKPNSGFKRKNELIRHQLVHNSPGYACPFCPDRDHKYPRPDNLQRHVKVHHTDRNKDDPELRAILAQRIDSEKGGRRRRVNSTS